MLEYMKALCSHSHLHVSGEVDICIRKLKNLEINMNINIHSQFIVEQLQNLNEYITSSVFP